MSDFDVFESSITLTADENLQYVMRAHLHSEQLLNALLNEALRDPGVLELDRLAFLIKARLAAALGLISRDVFGVLGGLNKLRNKFAHRADYFLTDQDRADFLNCIPSFVIGAMMKDRYGRVLYQTRDAVPLRRVLTIVVCLIKASRRDAVASKQSQDAALQRIWARLRQGWLQQRRAG